MSLGALAPDLKVLAPVRDRGCTREETAAYGEARGLPVRSGAKPAFLGYRGYPATLCISVNEEVVHGIPGKRKLRPGDVVLVKGSRYRTWAVADALRSSEAAP